MVSRRVSLVSHSSIIDGFCTALAVLVKTLNDNWPDIIQNIQEDSNDEDTDTEKQQRVQDAERLLKDTIKELLIQKQSPDLVKIKALNYL